MDGSRRSTAAQFFNDEEPTDSVIQQKVVSWLNDASLVSDVGEKTELLFKVQEVVVRSHPRFLDMFLQSVLAFQHDRNADVRKFVVGFIEEAVKVNWDILPKVMHSTQLLLQDSAPQIKKRVIQCFTHMYKIALMWLAKAQSVNEEMQNVWNLLTNLKAHVIDNVDNENDGLRTQIVKFLETLVLLQTYPEAESATRANDFSLEDIPMTLKFARRRKLEEEAMTVFDLMLKFHGSAHISSANLMTCMVSLTTIAKQRPQLMGKVVTALETLHMNLPPTLSTSQVNSVRKHLKIQLLNLLKHPTAADYVNNITTLLTDLGASTSEVMKVFPKLEEIKKRAKRPPDNNIPSKKPRLDEISIPLESAVNITEAFIVERLTPELAANMVIKAMSCLPDVMPPLFSATYTPIAAAGTQGQIKHVARLLATQLTAAGLGPGATLVPNQKQKKDEELMEEDDDEFKDDDLIPEVIEEEGPKDPNALTTPFKLPMSRTLKNADMAKPLSMAERENIQAMAIERILRAEQISITGGVSEVRCKLISVLASSFGDSVRGYIINYLLKDLKHNIPLALGWLYEEFSYLQSFIKRPPNQNVEESDYDANYNNLLCTLITAIVSHKEMRDRENMLRRIYTEAPLLTDESIEILRRFCSSEVIGLNIVNKLVVIRPPKQLTFINILLGGTSHQDQSIRETAIKHILELYPKEEMKVIIEEYAVFYLGFLRLPQAPEVLFGESTGRPVKPEGWTDESTKACLYLYLALLPSNHQLIHELAKVYMQTVADVKRTILRVVEQPVKAMGMESPELLKLVEECPKGSETLVTRLIHILTDKSSPSPQLVDRVRELYHTRVSDVRFLIPVLNGLSKQEVIAALPKLIKLNPIVVKEVFNRLLGSQTDGIVHSSPITPSELLIALHTIDPTKCELKTVIKATSLCFSDKQAYTQEVLAIVMQNLMEVTPLPTLLMRTVIQALSLYPRLIGFVMNILQRLILKQVWKQKKVWEGFIKCCQRTQPHSFQVLLQLPAPQLIEVFQEAPDLRKPLYDHIMGFTENQRAHIPDSVMDIITLPSQHIPPDFLIKDEPVSPPPELMMDLKEEVLERGFHEPAPPGMD